VPVMMQTFPSSLPAMIFLPFCVALAQLYQLAPPNGIFSGVPRRKRESHQRGRTANRV
jgi:hypothetical protein